MYPGHWATVFPDKPAVIDAATGDARTYRELNDRSNQLAQLMWAKGLRRGDHVSILMENNLAYFDVVWAAMRSGLYLTTVNRYLTGEEAGYIVDNSESQVLVTSRALAEVASEIKPHAPQCATYLMVDGAVDGFEDYEAVIDAHPAEPLAEEPAGSFMLYSSGTTGRPKGILRPMVEGQMIADDNPAIAGLVACALGCRREHRLPVAGAAVPLGARGLLPGHAGRRRNSRDDAPLRSGASARSDRTAQGDPQPVGTDHVHPHAEAPRGGTFRLRSLLAQGRHPRRGAPCPPEVKRQMLDWWGPILYEYYAGTELNGFTHCGPDEWLAHPGTVGKSILGVIHICDEDGNELPAGRAGHRLLRTPDGCLRVPQGSRKDPGRPASGARQLVGLGRRRLPGRRGLPLPHGPRDVHDHLRRGQHLPAGDRGRDGDAPEGGRRGGDRRAEHRKWARR